MQIGVDVGATKIESVLLEEDGNEKYNKFVNRFHSRIIFPIRNIAGDVIAFGGRIIKDKKIAKYINSPETEFYKEN